jgi:hypothetical protein
MPSQASRFPYVSCLAGCISFALILVGAGAAVVESNNHSTCESGLGQLAQAFSQSTGQTCAIDNAIFYAGIVIAIVGGIALFAALLIGGLRYRN